MCRTETEIASLVEKQEPEEIPTFLTKFGWKIRGQLTVGLKTTWHKLEIALYQVVRHYGEVPSIHWHLDYLTVCWLTMAKNSHAYIFRGIYNATEVCLFLVLSLCVFVGVWVCFGGLSFIVSEKKNHLKSTCFGIFSHSAPNPQKQLYGKCDLKLAVASRYIYWTLHQNWHEKLILGIHNTERHLLFPFFVRAQNSHRIMGKGRHLCPAQYEFYTWPHFILYETSM